MIGGTEYLVKGSHCLKINLAEKGLVKRMFVRGSSVRDISFILCISIKKVLKVLTTSSYQLRPKRKHYDALEIDEFWMYVGNKKNKLWLIADLQSDAYHRAGGE
jgi:hypothetical protein